MADNVNHPSHYETGQFECIDVMVETQGVEATMNFCVCNALKYIYRHKRKNGIEDIQKAIWYLNKVVELDGRLNPPVDMRKLKRSVARHNMLRAGFTRLNKKGADGKSAFARHWRNYI